MMDAAAAIATAWGATAGGAATGGAAAGGAAAGACVGSFIAAVTLRWPRGQPFLTGRSCCDSCGRALAPAELIPLFSFAVLGGRCRTCRAPIGARQPAIEIAGAVAGGVALASAPLLPGLSLALFGWLLLTLAVLDCEHYWLPDALTLPLAALGIGDAALFGGDLAARLIGLAAGYIGLRAVAALYRLRTGRDGLGGGDPKLFAAIGAWLGWQALPWVLVAAAIGGLAWLAVTHRRTGTAITGQTRLAFGTLLAAAAWLVPALGFA